MLILFEVIVLVLATVGDWFYSLHGFLVGAALILLLIWHHVQARQLLRWLRLGARQPLPLLPRPMQQTAALIYRLRRKAKKRKKRLQAVIATLNELSAAVPDPALIVDSEGRLLNANQPAQNFLGISRHDDIGRPVDYLIRGDGVQSLWKALDEQPRVLLHLLIEEDGWLECSRVQLAKGNYLLIARDVTRVMQLDQKRKAFVDNASHELKTPMTVISGYLEIFAASEDAPKRWQAPIAEMRRAMEQMQQLVEDMLQLARLEDVTRHLNLQPLAIKPWLAEMVKEVNLQYPKTVGVTLGKVDDLTLMGDEKILHTIVSNLLTNALLHAQSQQVIEISTEQTAQAFLIHVQDSGIGIAPEHLSRLTERFYRVDEQRGHAHGTGLGLAIVKHGIEAHDGRLLIESTLGKGSTFTLEFPLARLVQG